jgi:hypothetical protein
MEKVGKKIMVCDSCNRHKWQIKLSVLDMEKNKNDTVIKIPFASAVNPRSLK